ncbi:MFS transporter [Ferruginibacter sp. SUN106]|uniref:MFS transporter n=1 Tax=Ferruginibacter sp. SUN106 TaxID=2978348 RepID=UPI003D35B899
MQAIDRNKLFVASCLALLVTSLSFGIRAGLLGTWGTQFNLDKAEISTITATAFWGFPLAVIIGGMIVDIIGMKKLLVMAFIFHLAGILLTIFAGSFGSPYWALFISTLLIGIANGTVEAACNPLVTSLYTDNKTTKLNHFHLWFPGGIVIGSLVVYFFGQKITGTDTISNWKILVSVMLIPTLLYGWLFLKEQFPVTERVASGVSTASMYKALASPLFIFMIICMFGTAITELFTGQWIGVLLNNVTTNALLILAVSTGVMVIGRAFAGPVVHSLAPQGVLLMSAILAALGLYILGHSGGSMVFVGALIFGMGVCYFWPTMLGFVSENLPKTGAVGLNLMGGAGMFAVSIYTMFMGTVYDNKIAAHLPAGADLKVYNSPEATEAMKAALAEANKTAGPEIINTTLILPVILIAAFAGLFFYMRNKSKVAL